MQKMTILVTGGAGFIGSHLCDRLLETGQRVVCVDNFLTGSHKNIEHVLHHDDFVLIEHDIVEPLLVNEPVHQIYNLACPASPEQYQKNPVRTIKTNTIGMVNMLGLARKHGAVLLQASTSEVYGDPDVHPQPEQYRGNVNPIGPRACYDEGKRCAETLCFDYHRMHGMPIKLVRIFNTYGPRMAFDDGRVVSNFIVQALKGEPLTVYGDGSHTRSFCYVDDMVRGLISMMASDFSLKGPVNLGNPNEISVKELAERMIALTNSKSALESRPLPADDPSRRCPDISSARRLLDWSPSVDLEDGLVKTIADFQNRMNRPSL